jgi:hypothetical protein
MNNGLYIWVLEDIRQDYIDKLKAQNCKLVYLKVLDDASQGIFWSWQVTASNIKKFLDAGIAVVGWGYIFDKRSRTDTAGIVSAVQKALSAGCSGFVADVEEEVKNPATHAQLRDILVKIKAVVPPGTLGYTSFGNPEVHPEVPWEMLQEVCDYQQPQMYYGLWSGKDNKAEVENAFAQHKRMGLTLKPIYPIWTAEENSAGRSSPVAELQFFIDAYPGSSVYAAQCPNSWGVNYRGNLKPVPNQPTPNHGGKMKDYVAAPVPLPFARDLKLGVKGEDVFVLHCALAGLGLLVFGQQPDDFSAVTDDVVRFLQKKNSMTVDGVVGPKTKAMIEGLLTIARKPKSAPGQASAGSNKALFDFYSVRGNYNKVYDNVMAWYGTTSNACVAFMSTALRMSGTPVPHGSGYGGDDVSLVTTPFYKYLESKGWVRVDIGNLQPGDVCLTEEENDPGYPAHTYMFHSWESKSENLAYIIDNQGFTHIRNLGEAGGGFNFTPFDFALRAPV